MGACEIEKQKSNQEFSLVNLKNSHVLCAQQQILGSDESNKIVQTHQQGRSLIEIDQFPQLPETIKRVQQELGNFQFDKHQNHDEQGEQKKVHLINSNIIYEGNLKNGKFGRKGKIFLSDGTYIKFQRNDKTLDGRCRMIKQNGDHYQGQIRQFQANGKGKYRQGQITYEGQFYKNYPHGNGRQFGKNYRFKGIYQNGKKVKGTLNWNLQAPISSSYDGTFYEQNFDGKGILTTKKGKYQGHFLKGMKHGYGTFTWKNKSKFIGYYCKDKKNGKGQVYNPEGKLIIMGRWKDDQLLDESQV